MGGDLLSNFSESPEALVDKSTTHGSLMRNLIPRVEQLTYEQTVRYDRRRLRLKGVKNDPPGITRQKFFPGDTTNSSVARNGEEYLFQYIGLHY